MSSNKENQLYKELPFNNIMMTTTAPSDNY